MTKKCYKCNRKYTLKYNTRSKIGICSNCNTNNKNKQCHRCDTKKAIFGYHYDIKPRYCYGCSSRRKMVDISHTRYICEICNISHRKYKRNQKLCGECDPFSRKKTKELEIKSLLNNHNMIFDYNKKIGKYYVDFLFRYDDCVLILEVDEFSHRYYSKMKELERMNFISGYFSIPVKFIRYNPDNNKISKKYKHETLLATIARIDTFTGIKYLFYR